MTLEERVAFLEQELARRDSKPERPRKPYDTARKACEEYFEQKKLSGQNYGGFSMCCSVARAAFKEKHDLVRNHRHLAPAQYIQTEKDAAEYVSLFKSFFDVYQNYIERRLTPPGEF